MLIMDKIQRKLSSMETQNIVNLFLISICNILAGISITLSTPFYSTEALSKGVSVTESGLVFGSVYIGTAIVTPLFGKYHHIFPGGARTCLLLGSFICTFGNFCLGFLYWINSSSVFLSLSFVIFIITAIGLGAILSSVYSLSAQQGTKENEGKLISLAEACWGIGAVFGPSIGGILYEVGGFSLPFWACGGILLVNSLALLFFLKDVCRDDYESLDSHRSGLYQVLQVPEVLISMLSLALAAFSWHWYSASLAPFLSAEYELSPSQCGTMMMIKGLCYTLSTPAIGFLLDFGLGGLETMAIGNSLSSMAFILLGPIPQLEIISGNLWITALSMGLHGIGCASTYLGSLVYMLKSVTAAGFPNSEHTQVMVSSLWMMTSCLGYYGGSSLGGLAFDRVGFREGTLIESVVMAISVGILLIFIGWRVAKKKNIK